MRGIRVNSDRQVDRRKEDRQRLGRPRQLGLDRAQAALDGESLMVFPNPCTQAVAQGARACTRPLTCGRGCAWLYQNGGITMMQTKSRSAGSVGLDLVLTLLAVLALGVAAFPALTDDGQCTVTCKWDGANWVDPFCTKTGCSVACSIEPIPGLAQWNTCVCSTEQGDLACQTWCHYGDNGQLIGTLCIQWADCSVTNNHCLSNKGLAPGTRGSVCICRTGT